MREQVSETTQNAKEQRMKRGVETANEINAGIAAKEKEAKAAILKLQTEQAEREAADKARALEAAIAVMGIPLERKTAEEPTESIDEMAAKTRTWLQKAADRVLSLVGRKTTATEQQNPVPEVPESPDEAWMRMTEFTISQIIKDFYDPNNLSKDPIKTSEKIEKLIAKLKKDHDVVGPYFKKSTQDNIDAIKKMATAATTEKKPTLRIIKDESTPVDTDNSSESSLAA